MVNGLDTFKTYFADYKDCYVLIGGSACDVYFTDQDFPFRVTEDLDMILCVEALSPAFFAKFLRISGTPEIRTLFHVQASLLRGFIQPSPPGASSGFCRTDQARFLRASGDG